MKHLIQFRSGKYYASGKTADLFANPYATTDLLKATMYDEIEGAQKLLDTLNFPKGTKIISISSKELFLLKLQGGKQNG